MSPLEKIMEREVELISRFIALLEAEQEALKSAKPESLPEIHTSKETLVGELNQLENARIKLVNGPGALTDRERMNAWIKAHPTEKKAAGLWDQLLSLAHAAKQKNELNAALVKLHLEKTTQALAILTRHAQENTLYGSNGQASVYSGSRIVDSA